MKILFDPTIDPPEADPTIQPASVSRQTGIMRLRRGTGWVAVKAGRLVSEHSGPGCKAAAIQAAGTNRVIA